MAYKNREDALEYGRELRKYCKENHICVNCHSKDAFTMIGRTFCSECAEKMAKYKREKTDKEKRNQQRKELRQRHIENHECVVCGRKLPNEYEKKTCMYCLGKSRRNWIKNHSDTYKQRGMWGLCWRCNKEKALEGKKLCEKCYEKQVEIALNSLKYINKEKHYWRKQIQGEVKLHKLIPKLRASRGSEILQKFLQMRGK